jgi:hypothetical protein
MIQDVDDKNLKSVLMYIRVTVESEEPTRYIEHVYVFIYVYYKLKFPFISVWINIDKLNSMGMSDCNLCYK